MGQSKKEPTIGSRNRNRGKRQQRYTAKRLGGKNVGSLGGEDVESTNFSIECKSRVKSVAHAFMDQAVRNCPKDKMPLVIIHKHNDSHNNDLVCMRLIDWEAWNGPFGKKKEEEIT